MAWLAGQFFTILALFIVFIQAKEKQECRSERQLGMQSGQIRNEQISATSYTNNQRTPFNARLHHESAWQASATDYNQALTIDLTKQMLLNRVETQGLRGSDQFVLQYYIQYSTDNRTWISVSDDNNEPIMFDGNVDDNSLSTNVFSVPVVARYIRFNPQRWNLYISMRVELFGCEYEAYSASFQGNGFIRYDLSSKNEYYVQTTYDYLRMRFLTNRAEGILFYAGGKQGDYISLELNRGMLLLRIAVGIQGMYGISSLTLEGGSLLDDNQWHEILIRRDDKNVTMAVDRVGVFGIIYGDFYRLDLDNDLFLGGVTHFSQPGLTLRQNFIGCMENVEFDYVEIIRDCTRQISPEDDRDKLISRFSVNGDMTFNCLPEIVIPITFPTDDSYMILYRPSENRLLVEADFRSFNPRGLIFKNNLQESNGYATVRLNDLCNIEYLVKGGGANMFEVQDVIRNAYNGGSYCDGLWHSFTISIQTNKINLTVDGREMISTRRLNINSGDSYYFAGGMSEEYGFIGCMRNIKINSVQEDLSNLREVDNVGGINGTCGIRDRCHPNPCEHGGRCSQDWHTFECSCDITGYTGAVCHISSYENSCYAIKELEPNLDQKDTIIDIDGSGPLDPFAVTCNVIRDDESESEKVETHVGHSNENPTRVDGYQSPGDYRQQITYTANLTMLDAFINRADTCEQSLSYRCRDSKLLQKPGGSYAQYEAWGWWVGRSNQPMYYWGGSAPGSQKCACALEVPSQCEGNSITCNCDSGVTDRELSDSGLIEQKEHLPVVELRFGDTGTPTDEKYGQYKLGKLKCTGDKIRNEAVTFRKEDATIDYPGFKPGTSSDIRIEFKTKAENGIFFQNTGSTDFIEARLIESYTVEFRFNVGSGTQVLQKSVSYPLNNNEWHTIHMARNRKQSMLQVDKQSAVTLDEPQSQGFRLLKLSSNFVIGASVDYSDGFVGCMRGFQINGEFLDLYGKIERGEVTYGVSLGCVGKCESSPCLNGGTCQEYYSHYICDCAYTPYRGYICGREVGTNFQHGQYIRYDFDQSGGDIGTSEELITVGFLTKDKRGILMQITNEDNSEHLSLEVNNEGGLLWAMKVSDDQRNQFATNIQGVELANGQQHTATVRRENNGMDVTIWVDDYPPSKKTFPLGAGGDTRLNNPKYIYLGRNATIASDKSFRGCIFRAQFNNIFPLKLAFQDPKPPSIFYGGVSGNPLREDMCGYEEILYPPEEIEIRPTKVPPVTQDPSPGSATGDETPGALSAPTAVVLGIVIAIVVLVMIILAVLIWRYLAGRRGAYKTTEYGANSSSPNTGTGQQKKREWYI